MGMNAYHHARPLTDFSEDSLKPGKYVYGTIMSYVVSPRQPKGTDGNDPYFGIWNNFDGKYFGYIIPFNEEQYIYIWVKDQESLAILKGSRDGLHVNVPFVGQIEYSEVSRSDYPDDVLGFDHNKVISNYVIIQKNMGTEKFWIKACLLGLLVSFVLYRSKGRIEVSEAVRGDKEPQNVPCCSNITDEMAIVERRIRSYDELGREYARGGLLGAACIGTGVFVFVRFGSFTALVMLALSTWYGIRNLWRCFIHSKLRPAVFLAGLFGLRTLQVKRREALALLAELRKKEKTCPRPSPKIIPFE